MPFEKTSSEEDREQQQREIKLELNKLQDHIIYDLPDDFPKKEALVRVLAVARSLNEPSSPRDLISRKMISALVPIALGVEDKDKLHEWQRSQPWDEQARIVYETFLRGHVEGSS